MYQYFGITKFVINNCTDCKHYKQIYKYINILSKHITGNLTSIYKNINIIVNILKNVTITKLLDLVDGCNFRNIKIILNTGLITYDVPINILSKINKRNLLIIKYIYDKYDKQLVDKFLSVTSNSIQKFTTQNIDRLVAMFIITHIKHIKWFDQWGPGNHGNVKDNITKHHEKHIINGVENWSNYVDHYMDEHQYAKFAIDTSKYMTNKCVHTNGLFVYFSGIYGKVLIVGRLDDDMNLGISSCYVIDDDKFESKINNIKLGACFYL